LRQTVLPAVHPILLLHLLAVRLIPLLHLLAAQLILLLHLPAVLPAVRLTLKRSKSTTKL
jgi:hypothetical protein